MAGGERQRRFWTAVERWTSRNNARFGLPPGYQTRLARANTRFGIRHPIVGALLVGTELTIVALVVGDGAFALDGHAWSYHAVWILAIAVEATSIAICWSYYHYAKRHGEPPTSDL